VGSNRARWIAGVTTVLAIVAAAGVWAVAGRQDQGHSAARPSATPSATASVPAAERRMLAQVDAILKARASAVLTGRLPQYLQHVDPRNQKLRKRHQQVFANLRKIGLQQLSYRRETDWSPEPQPQHGALPERSGS
jgi:hypothetical protein